MSKKSPSTSKHKMDIWINDLLKHGIDEICDQDIEEILSYLEEEILEFSELTTETKTCRFNLRRAIYLLDSGGAERLGYSSLKECFNDLLETNNHPSTLYREAAAARVEAILLGPNKIGTIKESVLRPLTKLQDINFIKTAWKQAMDCRQTHSGFPTAAIVQASILKLRMESTNTKKTSWSEGRAEKIAEQFANKLNNMAVKFKGGLTKNRIIQILDILELKLIERT
ncbi:hypothetical protein [Methylomonas sp. HYX-M1]|uniref:hypothetical protein n=1 Tax=Methylomonas sp. HYX-M1 TaxID=3139307 RepID=UPI00345BD878